MVSSATIRLTISSDNPNDRFHTAEEFVLKDHETEEIFLGRARGNTVELGDSAVSGQHVRIVRQGEQFVLHDLGSRNGTHLNEERLQPNSTKLLRAGDVIRIVHYKIKFDSGVGVYSSQTTENTAQLALSMVKQMIGGIEQEEDPPTLYITSGVQEGQTFPLTDAYDEITIGRSPDCSLVLNDENMSRKHGIVRRDWSTGVTIKDPGSRNGILLNGKRIERGKEVVLNDRDEITMGTSVLIFSDPVGSQLAAQFGDVADGVLDPQKPAPPQPKKIDVPPPSSPRPSEEPEPAPAEEAAPPSSPPPAEEAVQAPAEESTEASEEEGAEQQPKAPVPVEGGGLTGGQKAMITMAIIMAVLLVLAVVWMFLGGE